MNHARPVSQHVDVRRPTVSVAVPPRVAKWITAAPDGPVRVLHACADVVYVDLLGRAVGISAAGAPGLPNTLRTNLSAVSSAGPPTAYLDSGLLHLDGRALVTRRLVDVRAPRVDADRMPKASPVVAPGTPRPRGAGLVPPASITVNVSVIEPDIVPNLVGRGEGLTPLGDDILCGWLAAHRAAGVPTPAVDDAVRHALKRTTTLSATLLECALHGEVADLVSDHLRALGTPRAAAAQTALLGLGHSSGAGLAHGIAIALAALKQEVAA